MEGLSKCFVFKSRLQEYAQKVGLTTPVYEVVVEGPAHEPSFSSTVVLDNKRYTSLPGFTNRKAAEQSAAEIALLELSNSGKMKETISAPVHEIGLCKNMLQEYALKMNYAIPLYTCERNEVTEKFICTVDVGGMKYVGGLAKTKKEAERKAARTALLAIKQAPGDESENPSRLTVIPVKRKVVEKPPKAKKSSKKVLGKKRKRANATADVDGGQNGHSEKIVSKQVEIPLPHIQNDIENSLILVSCLEGQVENLHPHSERKNSLIPISCLEGQIENLHSQSERENSLIPVSCLEGQQVENLHPQSERENSLLPVSCSGGQVGALHPQSERDNLLIPESCAEGPNDSFGPVTSDISDKPTGAIEV